MRRKLLLFVLLPALALSLVGMHPAGTAPALAAGCRAFGTENVAAGVQANIPAGRLISALKPLNDDAAAEMDLFC